MSSTVYRFKATNTKSYQSLANFIAPCMDVQATFFPLNKTIVIAFQGKDAPEIDFVSDHINDNALDFQTSPVCIEGDLTEDLMKEDLNPAALRDLISREIQCHEEQEQAYITRYEAAERELEATRKSKSDYYDYWMKALSEMDALKKQIQAISTLLAPLAD